MKPCAAYDLCDTSPTPDTQSKHIPPSSVCSRPSKCEATWTSKGSMYGRRHISSPRKFWEREGLSPMRTHTLPTPRAFLLLWISCFLFCFVFNFFYINSSQLTYSVTLVLGVEFSESSLTYNTQCSSQVPSLVPITHLAHLPPTFLHQPIMVWFSLSFFPLPIFICFVS